MPNDAYDAYGALARTCDDPCVVSGRYSFQRDEEHAIGADVALKLALDPADELLDVGSGSGNLVRAVAGSVASVVAVDNADSLLAFERCGVPDNCTLVVGRWPGVGIPGSFTKVLMYDVVQYVRDREELFAFVDAGVLLLEPGGRLLVGDIPNPDRKARFSSTPDGARFEAVWSAQKETRATTDDDLHRSLLAPAVESLVVLDDACVLGLLARYRMRGFDAFVLPQPPGLPFWHTREDVLVVRCS
jgi:SAM-dependent methyltransferase